MVHRHPADITLHPVVRLLEVDMEQDTGKVLPQPDLNQADLQPVRLRDPLTGPIISEHHLGIPGLFFV